jgi:hypothetical protein
MKHGSFCSMGSLLEIEFKNVSETVGVAVIQHL